MVDPASLPIEKLHHLLGAHPVADDRTRFCVWSPTHDRVWVELVDHDRRVVMDQLDQGYHLAEIEGVTAGSLYRYVFGGSGQDDDRVGRRHTSSRLRNAIRVLACPTF